MTERTKSQSNRSFLLLALVCVGMFGFGYALIPLYSVICRVTGLNGKSATLVTAQVPSAVTGTPPSPMSQSPGGSGAVQNAGSSPAEAGKVDANRLVTVQFVTTVNGGRAWEFKAEQGSVKVHPGELNTVYFDARNLQDVDVVGQAVPSVAPWLAATHLHKTECFCFNQQPFKASEAKRMPVRFTIDTALPEEVDTVTLSYTFFDVTQTAKKPEPAVAVQDDSPKSGKLF
jgi:cytochrome c oxidase assembly protein subunit 11